MKVVALVSGGKDSCYAMMRCIHFGHEIVALANLLPEDDTVDELDSYMYQTVGHQIVEAYAQCMGLPLFRKRIQGKPKSFELRYTETDGDEVEDLELLLRQVKDNIPEVDAVSTGAIASNYQRLRVENICSRLGLVSLAYLWMQDQAELLQQMVESGITAVLVKVAAMGLHPHKHLGKEISTMSPVLAELHEKYGCNVCGEGGEYETLTLDCPLFENARIVLDGYNIVLASAESVVQVAYLRPIKFHLEPKTSSVPAGVVHWVPDILKENEANPRLVNKENKSLCLQDVAKCHVAQSTHHVSINCWRISTPDKGAGAAGELDILLRLVQTYLVKEGLEWADVLYIHLYIRNMKDFALINSVYAQHITEQDCPRGAPSRSTVEVPLCNGEVMVEVLASRKKAKQVLHVQSISCWAPSCIGPYSQATLHGSLLFMAGQIGLDPPTMVLLSGGAGAEMHQCLLNAEAVAGSYGSKLTASSLSLTIYLSTMQRSDVEKCLLSFFASGSLPLVLFVLVSGLPKGASVEVEPLLLCSDETGVRKTFVHDVPSSNVGYSSESGDLVCTSDCYTVPGHLCRALVSIDYETWKVYKHESGVKLFTWLMELLNHTLKDADLQWSDVLAFRVYYMQSEPGVLDDLEQGIGVHLPTPLMVPVHGLGHDSELKSVFTFDILARNEAA